MALLAGCGGSPAAAPTPSTVDNAGRPSPLLPSGTLHVAGEAGTLTVSGQPVTMTAFGPRLGIPLERAKALGPDQAFPIVFTLRVRNDGGAPVTVAAPQFTLRTDQKPGSSPAPAADPAGSVPELGTLTVPPGQQLQRELVRPAPDGHGQLIWAPPGAGSLIWDYTIESG